jgi:glycosyltransferase involved in cell wall biosynthesis
MFKITVIIITKNEEKKMHNAIVSLSFCDELIVMDDESTDKTVEIAQKNGVKVYSVKINGDFSKARNDAIDKAKNEWILFIDADEIVSKALATEILNKDLSEADYWHIPRIDIFLNKEIKHGELYKAYQKGIIRMVHQGSGTWKGKIHEEYIGTNGSKTGSFKNRIIHYAHDSVASFLIKINSYSTIRAKELFEQGKRSNVFQLVIFPFGKFVYTFFVKQGFKDGAEGFIYSFIMAFHSFLVRGKLILMQ